MSYKGFFKPKNPSRYKGDPTNIIYRSSWELKLMSYLDVHPDIIEWSSEEFCIPYISPIDNKIHRYFVDFQIQVRDKSGSLQTYLIEIKPEKQTKPPAKQQKVTKKYLQEVLEWGKNEAKWKAAEEYANDRKWKFIILTENELGIKPSWYNNK